MVIITRQNDLLKAVGMIRFAAVLREKPGGGDKGKIFPLWAARWSNSFPLAEKKIVGTPARKDPAPNISGLGPGRLSRKYVASVLDCHPERSEGSMLLFCNPWILRSLGSLRMTELDFFNLLVERDTRVGPFFTRVAGDATEAPCTA
jgi:hypothetical protein